MVLDDICSDFLVIKCDRLTGEIGNDGSIIILMGSLWHMVRENSNYDQTECNYPNRTFEPLESCNLHALIFPSNGEGHNSQSGSFGIGVECRGSNVESGNWQVVV